MNEAQIPSPSQSALKSSSNKGMAKRKAVARGVARTAKRRPTRRHPTTPTASTPKAGRGAVPVTIATSIGDEVLVVGRPLLARLLGVHEDTVSKFTRSGMPVLARGGHGTESSYDAVACLAWYRDQQVVSVKEAAQARLFEANAQNAELKLRRDRAQLVSRDAIVLAGQAVIAGLRAKMLNLPVRLRHQGIIGREAEGAVRDICRADLKDIEAWQLVSDAMQAANTPAADA